MINSMTGFGRATGQVLGREVTVEVRAINNRFKDIIVRLPKGLVALEEPVKRVVAGRVSRGRVEVWIQMDDAVNLRQSLILDLDLARTYRALLLKLKNDLALPGDLNIGHFLEFRDIIRHEEVDLDMESFMDELTGLMNQALDQLIRMRQTEGRSLAEDFQFRLGAMLAWLDEIWSNRRTVIDETKSRLEARIKTMASGAELDPGRLAQEVAYLVDRGDITEEVVRLRSHVEQFQAALHGGGAVGRRLDFLLQEIGREVNTIGSKSGDMTISHRVVDLKTELEKIREQVQNVE